MGTRVIGDSIPKVILSRAGRHASREYLRYWDGGAWRSVSWSEAVDNAMRIAAGLVEAGLQPGESVALMAENRVEWLYCDLGIQAAGCVTVPIYPSSQPRVVRHIVTDSAARLAIASEALAGKFAIADPLRWVSFIEGDVRRWLQRPPAAAPKEQVERRLEQIKPDDIATVIYTSGTTGDPKGVVLTHRNFTAMASSALEVFDIGEDDTVLSFLPYSHVMERIDGIFVPSAAGATIWIARGMDTLVEDIQASRPTLMLGVPRVFEKVYERVHEQVAHEPAWKRGLFAWAMAAGARRLRDHGLAASLSAAVAERRVLRGLRARLTAGRLRFFISGGAPLNEKVEEFFWAIGVKILQGWGLTEGSSGLTSNTERDHRYRTVGLPLPGIELKLAEDGEILVKGPAVMVGYRNRPDATAETIVDGWLKTGDMGFLDGEGFLTITDRKKDLLKTSGGKYVAPLPIESRIASHRHVKAALVVGDSRPYASALIVPDWDAIAAERGLQGGPDGWVADEGVRAEFKAVVDECNQDLASFETVKRFALLPRDFSEEQDELTPTLKPKRRVIAQHFADVIDAMYAEAKPVAA